MIGFRTWLMEGYRLKSGAGEWAIGVNTAECRRDVFEAPYFEGTVKPEHEAPDHRCTCGLYAWYAPVFATSGDCVVFGAVTAWGHIEAQPQGFRSQYAEPVVLAYSVEQPFRHAMNLKAIAEEMRVPCVPLEELKAEAARHGQSIPAEMRPELPTSGMWMPSPAYAATFTASLGPTPPEHRPAWEVGAALNGLATLLNAGFFAFWGSWFNAGAGCVSAALTAACLLSGWRRRAT